MNSFPTEKEPRTEQYGGNPVCQEVYITYVNHLVSTLLFYRQSWLANFLLQQKYFEEDCGGSLTAIIHVFLGEQRSVKPLHCSCFEHLQVLGPHRGCVIESSIQLSLAQSPPSVGPLPLYTLSWSALCPGTQVRIFIIRKPNPWLCPPHAAFLPLQGVPSKASKIYLIFSRTGEEGLIILRRGRAVEIGGGRGGSHLFLTSPSNRILEPLRYHKDICTCA